MTRNLLFFAAVPACIAFQLAALPIPASGQEVFGGVGGVTRDSASKQPVAEVRITAHNVNRNTDRTAISGPDGAFTIARLEPGEYRVAAARDGFLGSTADVEVASPGTYRVDFLLAAASGPSAEAKSSSALSPATVSAVEEELAALKKRIGELEAALHGGSAPVETASARAPEGAAPVASPTPANAPVPAPAPQPAPPAAAPPAPTIPEALQAPDSTPGVDNFTPFAYADFTWLNGTSRNKDVILDTKYFTPEVRFDTNFVVDTNQPRDHSLGGSTEEFREGEFQVEQASFGGDFHWQNVRGRVLTMFGMFATTTPRNDASAGVGQWDLRDAYRYVSEAYGGYHFNVSHGLNIDAGIFVSYIGLFSYYNFDNWTYQPSYVSSNTPWFFNGLRIQWFPTNKLKIEPWIINGWQSYAKYNGHKGLGGQILYRPHEWLSLVFNNYGNGTDDLGIPGRSRIHTDDSIEVRYFSKPESTGVSKMAFSFTGDLGCEYGAGVTCHGGKGGPKQEFLGWMLYNRLWWDKDKFAITLGGGMMNNPGRYLTLLPPINGADAVSGTPYFTENPGDKAHMWDSTVTFHWMPKQYITWWLETGYRHSDVPYWSGRGGITPPGGNNGSPADYVCSSGASSGQTVLSAAQAACGGGPSSVWFPDLRHSQFTVGAGVMVKF
ncbi:MAG: TonB-dependent receptor [Bryobacteraceae bacterium]|jgi:hypothetical protein